MSISEHISELFRAIEGDLGTRDLDKLTMQALLESVRRFKPHSGDDFYKQMHDLIEMIKATRPRIALLIEHFYALWQVLEKYENQESRDAELCRGEIISTIESLQRGGDVDSAKLLNNGLKNIKNEDTILIHSHSRSVLDLLRYAKHRGRKFRVILAQQEMEKTHSMIEFLDEHKIRFQVIPEYMLSHIEGEIDKVFLGALTLNSSYNFVMDSGTMSLVSEFHLAKKPIYVFLTTRKFSMWKSKIAHHTYKVSSKKTHCQKKIDYEHIKFSHDRVPLHLFDFVVTEKGVFGHDQTKILYDEEYQMRDEWRKKFFPED